MFFHTLLCILFWALTVTVQASIAAQGYEVLYFYYAYAIDIQVNGPSSTLAQACSPSRGSPRCTLAEYVEQILYTQNRGLFVNGLARAGQGDRVALETINPTGTAASVLSKADYFKGIFNDKLTGLGGGKIPVFADMISYTLKVIEDSRNKAGSNDQDISALVDKAKDHLGQAIAYRVADSSPRLIEYLRGDNGAAKFPGLNLQTESIKLPFGETYDRVDTDATLAASPNMGPDEKEAFGTLIRDIGIQRPTGTAQDPLVKIFKHQRTINAVRDMYGGFLSRLNC